MIKQFMVITLCIVSLIGCGEAVEEIDIVEVVEVFTNGTVKEERVQLKGDTVQITTYHPNAEISFEGRVVLVEGEDVKEGVWTASYPDGGPWSRSTFIGGLRDGEYKTWHPNGQLNIRGTYDYGVAVGHWQFMDAKGFVTREFDAAPN